MLPSIPRNELATAQGGGVSPGLILAALAPLGIALLGPTLFAGIGATNRKLDQIGR